MAHSDRWSHWEARYLARSEATLSWFQEIPAISLDLIAATGVTRDAAIIDVGGGASRLANALVADGYKDVTVVDLSEAALARARARMGDAARHVTWVAADFTNWVPFRNWTVWHDRAAFHFLIDPQDRAAYLACLSAALVPGGYAIIGTFALDGPERCSDLPVERYDAPLLSTVLGSAFQHMESRPHRHQTPAGVIQSFQFSMFRRL